LFLFNYGNLVDPLLRGVRKRIGELSGVRAGDRVLDVCCGTGAQVLEFGRQGTEAAGIDISPNMLKIATRNMRQQAVAASFLLADAEHLPFMADCFDCATISLALHDKEDAARRRIIAEMKRVVRPGGALILVDYQVPLPLNVWGALVRVIEFLAGGRHYRGFRGYTSRGGLEGLLEAHAVRVESRASLMGGLLAAIKAANI